MFNKKIAAIDFVSNIVCSDKVVLDDQNVIVIYENPYKENGYSYIMVHYRLQDKKFFEVNRWDQERFYFVKPEIEILKDLKLFMIKGKMGCFSKFQDAYNAIYHYEKGQFIVKKGIWDSLGYQNCTGINDDIHYLEDYHCFIAHFKLCHVLDKKVEDSKTTKISEEGFSIEDKNHFAVLNLDGTIRGNRLFIGDDLFHIEQIVDLGLSTLEDYKKSRIKLLHIWGEIYKSGFAQKLVSKYEGTEEVMKILKKGF